MIDIDHNIFLNSYTTSPDITNKIDISTQIDYWLTHRLFNGIYHSLGIIFHEQCKTYITQHIQEYEYER